MPETIFVRVFEGRIYKTLTHREYDCFREDFEYDRDMWGDLFDLHEGATIKVRNCPSWFYQELIKLEPEHKGTSKFESRGEAYQKLIESGLRNYVFD